MRGYIKGIKNRIIRFIIEISKKVKPVKRDVPATTSRFLIVSTTGIGDTLWGTPAIRALKETYPHCFIGVLTTYLGAQILKGNPYIDKIFIFKRGLRVSLWKLMRDLRRERFNTAFIFNASDRIIWPLVFFTGVSDIIGITGQNKGLDFVLTKAITQQKIHAVEMRLRLVKEVGASCNNTSPALYLSEEDKSASELLKRAGLNKGSRIQWSEDSRGKKIKTEPLDSSNHRTLIIGLHPGAQKPFKCWPAERFIETGKRLVGEINCSIIITGSEEERDLCEYIASRIEGAISIAGETTLIGLASVFKRIDLFITNDTGPMHMANAVGTPLIALFCPTDPKLCGPYNIEKTVIIKKPIICDPCEGKNCQRPVCMEQITVEEVITSAKKLIERSEIYSNSNVNEDT